MAELQFGHAPALSEKHRRLGPKQTRGVSESPDGKQRPVFPHMSGRGFPTAPAAADPSPTVKSKPITIARPGGRARGPGAEGEKTSILSQSLPPRAPIIGSLPTPPMMRGMPDISLPAISPQAVSLLGASEPRERMVGVSSAPARTFIEQARPFVPDVPLGTTPTVLFTLMEERGGLRKGSSGDEGEDDDVPLGGSRAAKARGGSYGRGSVDVPLPGSGTAGPRTARLSSEENGDDSDSDSSSDEEEDLPFKLDL